jgi:signal transduction histidine kinase
MNIRSKTLGVMVLAVSLSSLAAVVVMHVSVMPSFADVEQYAVRRSVLRVMHGLDSEIRDMESIVDNFRSSYNIDDANKYNRFSAADISQKFENINIDILSVFDRSGSSVFHGHLQRMTGVVDVRHGDHPTGMRWDDFFLSVNDSARFVSGVLVTAAGPLLLAARPISPASGEGPSAGTVIMARYITPALIDDIRVRILTDFDIIALDGAPLPPAQQAMVSALSAESGGIIVTAGSDGAHSGYGLVKDVHGRPAMLIAMAPRSEISPAGRFIVRASLAALLLAGIAVVAISHALLQSLLVRPLRQLTDWVLAVGQGKELPLPDTEGRSDEIAVLGREFGQMLDRLAEANSRLLDQSYQAGVSQMAAGILHNLRNQMAPATLRLHRVGELAAQDRCGSLDQALAEALDPSIDPVRRAKLADFLTLTVGELRRASRTVAEEITIVADDFSRVSTLLDDIDRFSRSGGDCAPVTVAAVVADAVALMPAFPDQTVTIHVDPQLKALPPALGRRFVLKHVLHNLLVNAVESINRTGRGCGRIEILGRTVTEDGTSCIALTVSDNGAGICGQHLLAIFSRGFSTKGGNRHGMGLHWCATSIQAMGGRITAASDGAGRGASLQLVLPVALPLALAAE